MRVEKHGVKYRGAPRATKPINKTPGVKAAADDEPGIVCPDCGTRVKVRPDGLMEKHSAYGRAVNIGKNRFVCPSSVPPEPERKGPKQYKIADCRVLVTPEGVAHLVSKRTVRDMEGTPWVPLCMKRPIAGRVSNGREPNYRKRQVVRCKKCKTHITGQGL